MDKSKLRRTFTDSGATPTVTITTSEPLKPLEFSKNVRTLIDIARQDFPEIGPDLCEFDTIDHDNQFAGLQFQVPIGTQKPKHY